MTRRRNIRDVQVNRRYGALCVRAQCWLQVVMNFAQLAESDARGEEAQRRERHHAALIAAIVCNMWQYRTRLSRSVPPRFSNITEAEAWRNFRFRAEEFRDFCVHCDFCPGWCLAMDPRSMGKMRFSLSSVA